LAPTARWSFAEATLLRATGFVHLAIMAIGLAAPASLFGAWALPFEEPATFLRFVLVAYGALGLGLVRAAQRPTAEGALLVETTALVKLAFVSVIVFDILGKRLPPRAAIASALDVIFGVALYRAARRRAP
jgi:hypothetical protein